MWRYTLPCFRLVKEQLGWSKDTHVRKCEEYMSKFYNDNLRKIAEIEIQNSLKVYKNSELVKRMEEEQKNRC